MKNILYVLLFVLTTKNIRSQSIGGTLTGGATVCAGSNNGLLAVSNYSGGILRWETANNLNGPWLTIAHTSQTFNYVNLQQSAFFRVAVQSIGFSIAFSNVVEIICNTATAAGTISTASIQCLGSNVNCALSANTGTSIIWQYTKNNWISAINFGTINSPNAVYNGLTSVTQIRALVQNGICPAAFTNTLTVTPAFPSKGGIIYGNNAICFGRGPVTLSLADNIGSVLQWESSSSANGPFSPVSNSSNSAMLNYPTLNQNTYFRAVVQSANCPIDVSDVYTVSVSPPSVGGFIVGTQSVCANSNYGSLQLLANVGNITQWEYSNNNGVSWNTIANTNTLQSFSNLNANRVYRAVAMSGVCSAAYSSNFHVAVHSVPSASFIAANGCVNSISSFTNLSSGSASYSWSFGDGNFSSLVNPSNNYLNPGSYSVKLICLSTNACIDSSFSTITIFPKPIAAFVSSDSACLGTIINFANNSSIGSGSVSNVIFKFNDGSNDTSGFNRNHMFPTHGNYPVVMVVESNNGCRDSLTKIFTVLPKPQAKFKANNICKGKQVTIDNQSTITYGNLNYQWSFGNSETSIIENPKIFYQNAGSYTVALVNISNYNCSDTAFETIHVHENPTLQIIANNVCFGSQNVFTTISTPNIPGLSYTLNFGDNASSTNPSIDHLYSSDGIFFANVTSITDSGCVATAATSLAVFPKPKTEFIATNLCQHDSIEFQNTSTLKNGWLNYLWAFGTGDSSETEHPIKKFTNAGIYTVSLIAKSNNNCYDTSFKNITVYDAPLSDFEFTNSCDGALVSFTNTSQLKNGNITNYFWDFGDSGSAVNANPYKTYLNSGSFSVSLIVQTVNKCMSKKIKTVTVYESPIANFKSNAVCLNSASHFENLSSLHTGAFTSNWSFGDGAMSQNNAPIYYYKKPGQYSVTLKTTSDRTCTDSITKFVEVFALPQLIVSRDTSIDSGMEILLHASGATSYSWYPTESLNDPVSGSTVAKPSENTIYYLFAQNENACTAKDSVEILVRDNFLVIPHNILTPNNNGKNDTWIVKYIEAYPENEVLIFDQWNQIVYTKNNYQNEWEGKNMRGEMLPDATYYYMLSIKGREKKYTGYITLLRNGE